MKKIFTVFASLMMMVSMNATAENVVPTNAELWESFKAYFLTYYNTNRADQPIENVSTFMTKGCEIMTKEDSEYKWLGDYIIEVSAAQGFTLTNDPTADGMEALWRWSVHSFFNCNVHDTWPKTADFTEAGKPENWGPYYPAKETPDYEIMDVEMSNLTVTDMGDFVMLEASDDVQLITVTLGVYEDGHLHEGSAIDWDGNALTIVEGSIKKTTDAEKGDVYTGLVVIEHGGGKVGLNLTMYTKVTLVEINITEGEATVDTELSVLSLTATWEGYPVLLTVAGYEEAKQNYEDTQVSEITIGDEDNWYDFAIADAVTVVAEDGEFTIEGQYKSWATGVTYAVTLTATLPGVEPSAKIEWELNGGKVGKAVPTNAELWEEFKPYFQTYYNVTRADQEITLVSTFMTKGCEIMTKDDSEYKWLGDYIIKVSAEQGYTLTDDPTADGMEALWRWSVHSFFNCNQHTSWPKTADFATAGKPEAWGPAFSAVYGVELPKKPVAEDYVLPTPTKEGYTFVGWYDNAEGTGEAWTVIPAGWSGKLYAIWKENTPTALQNTLVVEKAVKFISNGQVFILVGDKTFNVMGQQVK